jgi:signal transduction histidine kinase
MTRQRRFFPLRYKMTIWYTLMSLVLLVGFSMGLYFVTQRSLESALVSEMKLAQEQLIVQVENENGNFKYENEVPVSSSVAYLITNEKGEKLLSSAKQTPPITQIPWEDGIVRSISLEGQRFLLRDSQLLDEENFPIRMRMTASLKNIESTLQTIRSISYVIIPLMMAMAAFGGLIISKRSLLPIHSIVSSAQVITAGDLSERIPETTGKDEVGELITTINHMLNTLEAAFEREKRFTSDASHELRMPVSVIMAYAESLLADARVSQEDQQAIQTILIESRHMERIITQLLMITRGQADRYSLCMEDLSVAQIVQSVGEQYEDLMREKNITLQTDIPPGLNIKGDLSLLSQLLLNLIENAVKYGKQDGYVRISAEMADNLVSIKVRDNGIGIPVESLPHLFERFYRVDTSRDRSGTGLGLSIAAWIAKAHGGEIRVESKLGQGTCFTVLLMSGNPAQKESLHRKGEDKRGTAH